LVAGVLVSALLWPSAALAARRTFTLRTGPVAMGAYNVAFPRVEVPAPGVDGYVIRMSARLVDGRGRPVTIHDVMLHHTVFFRRRQDPHPSSCTGLRQEAFYGTGEENESLRLPAGYGYRIERGDRWRMHAMLMSHGLRRLNVYVQYRVTVVTGVRLKPVLPFWVRASGCRFVTYAVWGGGPPGSTRAKTFRWRSPVSGRIVAVGGHLHGGAKDMWLSQPRCGGRRLLDTAPRFGMPDDLYYRARPILHEPGPAATRYFLSRRGIAVRRGEPLDLTGTYDNELPHPRVMAIMHVYIAPGPVPRARCAPLPRDRREILPHRRFRTAPPRVVVPLNGLDAHGHSFEILEPPWPARAVPSGATVHLRAVRFSPQHVAIQPGDRLTFSFDDAIPHNLTFANGPRLIRGPTAHGGRRVTRGFTVPGRYELFCYLHPLAMHEVVDVGAPP